MDRIVSKLILQFRIPRSQATHLSPIPVRFVSQFRGGHPLDRIWTCIGRRSSACLPARKFRRGARDMRRTGAGLFLSAPHNDDPPAPSIQVSLANRCLNWWLVLYLSSDRSHRRLSSSQRMLLSFFPRSVFDWTCLYWKKGCQLTVLKLTGEIFPLFVIEELKGSEFERASRKNKLILRRVNEKHVIVIDSNNFSRDVDSKKNDPPFVCNWRV